MFHTKHRFFTKTKYAKPEHELSGEADAEDLEFVKQRVSPSFIRGIASISLSYAVAIESLDQFEAPLCPSG